MVPETNERLSESPHVRRSGLTAFTLVELLVVVSILAILASIAVPNYLSSRARSNESAVISLMRGIVTGEQLFVHRHHMDLDNDSTAEHGFLGELSGVSPLRGSGLILNPPVLSRGFVTIDSEGFGERDGYIIRLYLPDSSGAGVPETAALLSTVDPELAAHFYAVAAWPATYGTSGQRTFYANQSGEIVATVDSKYSGKVGVPLASAALLGVPPSVITTDSLASAGEVGSDGNRWMSVR